MTTGIISEQKQKETIKADILQFFVPASSWIVPVTHIGVADKLMQLLFNA